MFFFIFFFYSSRAYKQEVISALSLLFGGNEVVVNEIFAAEVPNKTNFRFYIQQVFPNGKRI